ncbi:hypothetical protein [Mycolicibacter terrae]|uniref:hypothetical protein n=1 Tax=Mycolicibacter terrae TaxID=1788 RepID=UPI0013D4F9AC|nr:hypothetical protein [Mycolicibacter terrae]
MAELPGSAAADDWFGSLFYTPLHDLGQQFILSPFGAEVSSFVNMFGFGQVLIGNGVDGVDGGRWLMLLVGLVVCGSAMVVLVVLC